jgi:glucose/mannose-6-phosphate isomerase
MSAAVSDVVDSADLAGQVAGLADRLDRDLAVWSRRLSGLPERTAIEHVLVLATGADAVAAAAVVAAAGTECPVPLVVSSAYELPGFVGDATLVIVSACDLEADEVVEAASAAQATGAHLVIIGGGPRLGALEADLRLTVPEGVPSGRLRVVEAVVGMVVVLDELGLYATGRSDLDSAVTQLRERDRKLGDARRLARQIGGRWPVIHGAGPLGGAAAAWWKQAMNTLAKAPALHAVLPDAARDEVAGWGQHGDVSRQVLVLVNLRHDAEHPALTELVGRLEPWETEVVGLRVDIHAEGEGLLAQWFDLMAQGTAVALESARIAGVDPGPAPVLDSLLV